MQAQWVKQWKVASHSDPTKEYTVSMRADGTMACDCPRWKFHKAPKVDCKHATGVRTQESPDELRTPTPRELEVMARAVQHEPSMKGMLIVNAKRRIVLED